MLPLHTRLQYVFYVILYTYVFYVYCIYICVFYVYCIYVYSMFYCIYMYSIFTVYMCILCFTVCILCFTVYIYVFYVLLYIHVFSVYCLLFAVYINLNGYPDIHAYRHARCRRHQETRLLCLSRLSGTLPQGGSATVQARSPAAR